TCGAPHRMGRSAPTSSLACWRGYVPSWGRLRSTEPVHHRVHFGSEGAGVEVRKLCGVRQTSELMHQKGGLGWCRAAPGGVGSVDEPRIPRVHPAVAIPI